jgi:hypothetical protein
MTANAAEYEHEEVINKLKQFVESFPTKGEAAKFLGVGRVFLWRVLDGQAPPSNSILKHIGFEVEHKTIHVYKKLN